MMQASILLLVTIVPLIKSHDVAIGLNNYGKKIFAENRQASPAIWRQKENVTIEAAENEMITKVIIIDMRPEKDGDARIVDGGEGKKNVTIELKSPTVLRGYDFHIEVFSAPDTLNSGATSASGISSTVPPTPNCNHQTATDIGLSQKITSTADSSTKNGIGDNIRPVRTTFENNKDTNIEGSTLHTSISTSSVTSAPSNADDEATTLVNEITTLSNETSTFITDVNNKDGNNLAAEQSMISNETTAEGTIDEFTTTTLSDITTEVSTDPGTVVFTNGKDVLDFPDLIGMNDDDTRHAREAKLEITSTISDITTEVTTEQITTLSPENSTDSESIPDFPALSGLDGNDTRHSRGANDEDVTSTISYTNEGTTETISSPESVNNKASLDFASFNSQGKDETMQNSDEEATSTEGTTTETGTEISTTITSNNYENNDIPNLPLNPGNEEDIRQARQTKDSVNDMPPSIGISTESEDYSGDGEDDTDISGISNVFGDKDNSTTTEDTNSQIDMAQAIPKALFGQESDSTIFNSTGIFYNPLNVFENTDDKNDSLTTQDTSSETPVMDTQSPIITNNRSDQVVRNSRDAVSFSDIFGNNFVTDSSATSANYPVFVNPSISLAGTEGSDSNNDDYVYIPLIAIINKSSYPSYQDALQSLMSQSRIANLQTPN